MVSHLFFIFGHFEHDISTKWMRILSKCACLSGCECVFVCDSWWVCGSVCMSVCLYVKIYFRGCNTTRWEVRRHQRLGNCRSLDELADTVGYFTYFSTHSHRHSHTHSSTHTSIPTQHRIALCLWRFSLLLMRPAVSMQERRTCWRKFLLMKLCSEEILSWRFSERESSAEIIFWWKIIATLTAIYVTKVLLQQVEIQTRFFILYVFAAEENPKIDRLKSNCKLKQLYYCLSKTAKSV